MICLTLDFDPVKNLNNLHKHGYPLSLARHLYWELALIWSDLRKPYLENRMSALVPMGDTLFFVAFVDRGSVRRVISLRQANSREVKRYVENT